MRLAKPFLIVLAVCGPAWAAKNCSDEALYKVASAAACLDQRDTGCAKLKVDEVLEREPNCAEALFVKGWILQFHDQKVEAGQELRDRALELNPKLENFWVDRGHAIESHLSSQPFSHFDLQFYGAENRGKAWDAVRYLNDMYDQLGSVFGVLPRRIPVIVFTTSEFLDAWRSPYILGFFDKKDGKVRIRVDEIPGGEAEFRHRARHEFTHAFMYQIYPHDLPSWATEGIAEYYAQALPGAGFWKEDRLDAIWKTIRNIPWLTLDDIQEAIAKKRVAPYKIQQAYLESEALVIVLAKSRGDSWIPNVMTHLRKHGGTFNQAFEAVLGITPETAMEQLHHHWQ